MFKAALHSANGFEDSIPDQISEAQDRLGKKRAYCTVLTEMRKPDFKGTTFEGTISDLQVVVKQGAALKGLDTEMRLLRDKVAEKQSALRQMNGAQSVKACSPYPEP